MTRIPAALLLVALSGPAFSADDAPALCKRLVFHARQMVRSPVAFSHAVAVPEGLLTPDVRLARRTDDPALAKEALRRFLPDAGDNSLGHLETSNGLWRVEVIQGTLRCEDDAFFTRRPGGKLVPIPSPDGLDELCWTSGRHLGTVDGRPALIEIDRQDRPLEGMDVVITPWANGWRPPCHISLRYDDSFRLSEEFCADTAVCRGGAALAPKLAQALARDPDGKNLQALADVPSGLLRANADRLKSLKSRISDYGDGATLPTFGRNAKTPFPDYSYPTTTILVQVAGQTLAARVGIGGVGWRAIGDYLITFYRLDDATQEPLASYVVERKAIGLRSAAASIPVRRKNRH